MDIMTDHWGHLLDAEEPVPPPTGALPVPTAPAPVEAPIAPAPAEAAEVAPTIGAAEVVNTPPGDLERMELEREELM